MNHFVETRRAAARFAGLLLAAAFPLVAAGQAPAKLDRTVLPIPEPKRPLYTELDARNVKAPPRFQVAAPPGARARRSCRCRAADRRWRTSRARRGGRRTGR